MNSLGNFVFAEVGNTKKAFSFRIKCAWLVEQGEVDLSGGLDWKCLAAVMRWMTRFSCSKNGDSLEEAQKKFLKTQIPNPLEDLGYLGWLGEREEGTEPNVRLKPWRRSIWFMDAVDLN